MWSDALNVSPSPRVARARARLAGTVKNHPDADVTELRRDLKAATLAERIRTDLRNVVDIDAWAESVAAALSPLTPDEAAAVGRLAAVLDGRRPGPSGPPDNRPPNRPTGPPPPTKSSYGTAEQVAA